MENSLRKNNLKSCALYFFLYCPLGVLCPLIGQYLSSIGFSGTQVGVITSLGTASAIIGGFFWGHLYANNIHKRRIIIIMCVCASALALTSTLTKIFIVYAVIYSIMYFFQGPIHGLCDSLIISKQRSFSYIRAFGAVGYAVAVYFAGKYAENHGLNIIFFIYAITFVITALIILTESEPPHYVCKEEKVSMRQLFKDKDYVQLLICSFFVMGTNTANGTYFGYLFRDGGGSVAGIGLAFLLMAGSEAPFMILTPKLSKRFGQERIILFAFIVSVARYAFYATGPGYIWLILTFFTQGISNGILLVELVKYFGRIVEPKLSSLAISTYYAIGNNLSVILCSLVGGILLDAFGAQGVYLFFTIYNVIAVVLYIAMKLYIPRELLDTKQ